MRVKLVLCMVVLLLIKAEAQQIIWANEVMDVSSEFGESEYSSKKILGSPDAMLVGAKKGNSWRPAVQNAESFITVSFPKSMIINQLIVGESENPGAIQKYTLTITT